MRQDIQLSQFVNNVGYPTALEFFERIEKKTDNGMFTTFMDLLRNTPPELREDLLSKDLQHFKVQYINKADAPLNYIAVIQFDWTVEHHFLHTPDRMYEGDQELLEKGVHLVYTPISESIFGEQRDLRPTLDTVIQNTATSNVFDTRSSLVHWRLFDVAPTQEFLCGTGTKYVDVAGSRYWVVRDPTPHYCYVGPTPSNSKPETEVKNRVVLLGIRPLWISVPSSSEFEVVAKLVEGLNRRLSLFNETLRQQEGKVIYQLQADKVNVTLIVGGGTADDCGYVYLRLLPLGVVPEVVRANYETLYYQATAPEQRFPDELLDSIIQQLIA
jgi:hypothetical protein